MEFLLLYWIGFLYVKKIIYIFFKTKLKNYGVCLRFYLRVRNGLFDGVSLVRSGGKELICVIIVFC